MARSIRTRLLVSFIVLAVGPLLLLGVVFALMAFNVLQNLTISAQQQEAVAISAQVGAVLDDPIQRMQMLIHVDGLGIVDRDQQRTLLDELMNYDHGLNELAVVDTTGQEQVRITRRAVLGQNDLRNVSQADKFTIPSQTKDIYYSTVQIDEATGEPLITVAIPMFDLRSGTLDGILVGDVRFRPIWDLIANMSAAGKDTIYIVDKDGRIVAHQDPTVVLKSTMFSIPAQTGPVNGLNGNPVILASSNFQFGSQNFSVVTERPVAEAFALAINQGLITLVVILLALFGALIIGIVTVQRLVRPIVALSASAEAISAGDLTRRVNVTGHDEITTLGNAFNSMTTQLAQTLDGLRRNVTELEQANRERAQLIAELREASRLKSEFLATMSHELRTPLNAMIGFTELLMAGTSGPLNDKQKHQLSRVHANSLRLLSLIDDVLDLSRIEAGRIEILHDPFSPRDLITKIVSQTSSLAENKGLALQVNIDMALPQTLLGDQPRIEQVLINLLSNAVKFTEKGEVELTVKPEPDQQRWSLSVRDTGIGIPPHAQEYIFEEFRQVDGSSRRMYGGSGLGLAICRNLTRLMAGDVRVQSTLGQGSTFTVTLPLELPKTPSVVQPTATPTTK